MTTFHEQLAEKATPGPWRADPDCLVVHDDLVLVADGKSPENAALIAACPPEMVQAWENGMKALREIAGVPDEPSGIHWVGDEQSPELCPGCIAAKALRPYDAQVAALQEENDDR